MENIKINTLTEFTKLIEETFRDQSDVLFRGQPGDFPLLPSIARERLTDDILAVEKSMLDEFRLHSLPFLKVLPSTIWEWAALAQHHGLPTRLIDWSLNPLTSLWFAVNKPSFPGLDGVLWILKPSEDDFPKKADLKSIQCKRHMVFAPKHVSERITSQVAWFTIHKAWSKQSIFEPMESSKEFESKLTKVIIPNSRFAHLRFHLDRYGINHASVFPDLDGLCAHIKWKRCYMPDEGEK
jgi:hypothetical protein